MLKQFRNSANNTLYSHYKAPCYDFITVQARALWLLTALNPGIVCVVGACTWRREPASSASSLAFPGIWCSWAHYCSGCHHQLSVTGRLGFWCRTDPPFYFCARRKQKWPCVFKFLLVHMACLAIDLCPKPAELNLPRMTTVYSGFSYITAVAAFHIALI